jgi:hypothetical protein
MSLRSPTVWSPGSGRCRKGVWSRQAHHHSHDPTAGAINVIQAKNWRNALRSAAHFSLISAVNIGFEQFTPSWNTPVMSAYSREVGSTELRCSRFVTRFVRLCENLDKDRRSDPYSATKHVRQHISSAAI